MPAAGYRLAREPRGDVRAIDLDPGEAFGGWHADEEVAA